MRSPVRAAAARTAYVPVRLVASVLGICAAMCLPACEMFPSATPSEPSANATGQVPSYQHVVTRYNQAIATIDRLWARHNVDITWVSDGKRHHENAEGNLLMLLPDRIAFTAGKLGVTKLWAGCDGARYWVIDIDRHHAFFGKHESAAHVIEDELPWPVEPRHLPALLGLTPLDPSAKPDEPDVERIGDLLMIEPPELSRRILLDPATMRPARIDLIDEAGRSWARAQLSNYKQIKLHRTKRQQWPTLASHIQIDLLSRGDRIVIKMHGMNDGRDRDRIKARAFDFDRLIKTFNIPPESRIDLDARHHLRQRP